MQRTLDDKSRVVWFISQVDLWDQVRHNLDLGKSLFAVDYALTTSRHLGKQRL